MNRESESHRQDLYMSIGVMKDPKTKAEESTRLPCNGLCHSCHHLERSCLFVTFRAPSCFFFFSRTIPVKVACTWGERCMHAQQGVLGSPLGCRPMPTSSTGSGWLELKVCVLVSLVLFFIVYHGVEAILQQASYYKFAPSCMRAWSIMRDHRWQAKQAYPPGSVCGSNWSMISGASKRLSSFHVRISPVHHCM